MPRNASASSIPPPYSADFDGVLSFTDFASAEATLHRLEELRQRFQSAGDKKGIEYCRLVARLGRRRAELIGRNVRVNAGRRLQKREMSTWFAIWLETPDLFEDWLALRKQSDEFHRLQQPIPADRSPRNSPAHGLRA
jgi:hypothetical protein